MPLEKKIYVGPFIHCVSLTEVEICLTAAIGVDEHGKIAFVLKNVVDGKLPTKEGWESAKTVKTEGNSFFFPGFIGERRTSVEHG